MVGALVKRRNAARGLGWRALREPPEYAAAALRPLQIQPVFPAERALLRRILEALKSCELMGQDTTVLSRARGSGRDNDNTRAAHYHQWCELATMPA